MLKSLFLKFKEKLLKSSEITCIHTITDCEECMSASHCSCKDTCIVHVKKGVE